MSPWRCCFISFMLHFWFPPESPFFSPPWRVFISVSVYAHLKSHVPPCPRENAVIAAAGMKTMCIWAIKCRTTSSKGQIEKRGHTKAWTRRWINTLIGGNYVLGAPLGLLSSARGPHKYTFKRHVARSRSNLLTMNLCIMVFIINSRMVPLWRNQQSPLNINTCKWMLCLFELRTPSRGTGSVWFQLWRRRQKYQMPVVPGWHRPLPLLSRSLPGSADADFLLSTTCSENIRAVKGVRGAAAGIPEEEPLNDRGLIMNNGGDLTTWSRPASLIASQRLERKQHFIWVCKGFWIKILHVNWSSTAQHYWLMAPRRMRRNC